MNVLRMEILLINMALDVFYHVKGTKKDGPHVLSHSAFDLPGVFLLLADTLMYDRFY